MRIPQTRKGIRQGFGSFFRTHPPLDSRIEKVEEEISFLPVKDEYIVTTSRLELIQKRLEVPELSVPSGNGPTLKRKPNLGEGAEKKKEKPTLKRGDE